MKKKRNEPLGKKSVSKIENAAPNSRENGKASPLDEQLVNAGPSSNAVLYDFLRHFVVERHRHGLQLGGAVLRQDLGRVGEVVGLGQGPQVKIVLDEHALWHVRVELQQVQKLAFQFVTKSKDAFIQVL